MMRLIDDDRSGTIGFREFKQFALKTLEEKRMEEAKFKLRLENAVTIVKKSRIRGYHAEVIVKDWHGLVKVKMLDGPDVDQIKSYHAEDLQPGKVTLPPHHPDSPRAKKRTADLTRQSSTNPLMMQE